jgi:hypothetical protein
MMSYERRPVKSLLDAFNYFIQTHPGYTRGKIFLEEDITGKWVGALFVKFNGPKIIVAFKRDDIHSFIAFTSIENFGDCRGQSVQWTMIADEPDAYLCMVRENGDQQYYPVKQLLQYYERYSPTYPGRIVNTPNTEKAKQLHFPTAYRVRDPILS